MEESVSGSKITGSWRDVVEHGERFDEEIDRWHIDTEPETANVEAAEGVEM